MITSKKVVLLLFGGESAEHDVSIISAKNIYSVLDLNAIHPILGYIDRLGSWWYVETITEHPDQRIPITPILGKSAITIGDKETKIDVLFPVLHGQNGEDGTVQGLARLMHTPVVGCDMTGSLLCMDKPLAKRLLEAENIPVVPGESFTALHSPDFDTLTKKLGSTLFVKPARQGSSVGVGKVTTEKEFNAAFMEAARYDDLILIESAVEDVRELEVAVLGSTNSPEVSVIGEIVPDREFYNYESKYDEASTSKVVIPAEISSEQREQIQMLASKAYTTLRCRGLARVDFFLDAKGRVFLNEINTMPGFTNISMYPKLWEASGLPYQELVSRLLQQAVDTGLN